MNKILLVGNGFTSHLIPAYAHEKIMAKIKEQIPNLYDTANTLFEPFRKQVDSVQYSSVAAGYSGDMFCGGFSIATPITGRPHNIELINHIKNVLQKYGFSNIPTLVQNFFQAYGLVYETQKDEISNVESFLKIIALFRLIGEFTESDDEKLTEIVNTIYFNNGQCGQNALTILQTDGLKKWLTSYKCIFTTNYDIVLDELLQTEAIKHLHGGFFYSKQERTKRSNTLVYPGEACLIWGISGAEKEKAMEVGGGMSFPFQDSVEFPVSIFVSYLSELQNVEAERVDIFGYSGENDQHINDAIKNNWHINEVHYFCDPRYTTSLTEQFDKENLFVAKGRSRLVLESWDTVWNKVFAFHGERVVPEPIPE